MTTQNYDPALDLVKEHLEQIDKIKEKFSGFPEVQKELQSARDALIESEEEIMNYYDLTDIAKRDLNEIYYNGKNQFPKTIQGGGLIIPPNDDCCISLI